MNKNDIVNYFNNLDFTLLKRFRREVPFAVALLLLSFVFYRYVYQRNVAVMDQADKNLQAAHAEVDRIKAEIQASESLKRSVDEAAASLKKAEEKFKSLNEKLPSMKRISRILSEIAGQDASGGVRILSVKPLPVEDKGELIRLPFQITLEARFQPFGEYLERLENLQRVMIVDNFLIEAKDDAKGTLTAQMYLSAYVFGPGKP